jgi:hypothetical protein
MSRSSPGIHSEQLEVELSLKIHTTSSLFPPYLRHLRFLKLGYLPILFWNSKKVPLSYAIIGDWLGTSPQGLPTFSSFTSSTSQLVTIFHSTRTRISNVASKFPLLSPRRPNASPTTLSYHRRSRLPTLTCSLNRSKPQQ